MTATTPPITAWYVLDVEGTGLASAQVAEGEKRETGRGCSFLFCSTGCPRLQLGTLEGPILLGLVPPTGSCRRVKSC